MPMAQKRLHLRQLERGHKVACASRSKARAPLRAKEKVDLEWFASSLITSHEEASSVALSGGGCANRLYCEVVADTSEMGRKTGKINASQQFCKWLQCSIFHKLASNLMVLLAIT